MTHYQILQKYLPRWSDSWAPVLYIMDLYSEDPDQEDTLTAMAVKCADFFTFPVHKVGWYHERLRDGFERIRTTKKTTLTGYALIEDLLKEK